MIEGIRSVVAVEAHPDDVELSCMGILIKLHKQGVKVNVVSVTRGDKGAAHDLSITDDQIAAIRKAEASQSIGLLGGEFLCLGADDEYLFDTREMRHALTAAFRRFKADLVLVSPPMDYQMDHITTTELAFQAAHFASLGNLNIDEAPLAQAPRLYYYDAVLGLEFIPSFYVDITDEMEEKKAHAALHKSQMENMQKIGSWDLVTQIEIVGRYRGLQSGVQYAEAFQPCLRFPRVRALRTFPS
jgi:LmbE family N-acetylglucosaminyl deacetylase